jgi:hypothetical protein
MTLSHPFIFTILMHKRKEQSNYRLEGDNITIFMIMTWSLFVPFCDKKKQVAFTE